MRTHLWGILAMAAMAVPAAAAAPGIRFYVATNGNDAWSGRQAAPNAARTDGPFATVTRARAAVRALKEKEGGLKQPVTILIRGGFYPLAETLRFTPEDSGTAAYPVTYAAYPGEQPVLSGGRRLGGWQKGEGELWTTRIPEVAAGKWYFRQLFVNGQRRTRARTPNDGYLRADLLGEPRREDPNSRLGFRFQEGDLKPYPDLEDVNVVIYHSWTASWHHIAEVNTQERTVKLAAPSGWPIGYWDRRPRYVVENTREALDAPGEWYLDRKTGVLTYWPLPGESLETAEVVAPALRTLLRFTGDPEMGLWVEHLNLEGLSFQHADWHIERDKPADGQAAVFLNAAVMATGMRRCALTRCEVAHVGEHAVWLQRGSVENRLEQSHLHDLGAGGVYIGEALHGTVPAVTTGANTVHNCFIHDGGHVFPAGIGVWIGQSPENHVSHNEICDFYYSGMSVGWTWGYTDSAARGNLIEFNHIHHLGKGVLSDMGGIYTLGIQPGTVLRNNCIHDVLSYSYGGWGLYTDEGSTGILLEKNVVYRTKSGGFHQHYGRENVVRNNIFAIASEGEIIRSREEDHLSFIFERNIVYQTLGPLLGSNWSNHQFRMDRNLYWHTDGWNDLTDLTLAEWQEETGQDRGSLVADPRFVAPEQDDFRLRPDSPALQLGFEPIDLSTVGLVGDKAWTDLPKQVKREPMVLPEPAPRQGALDDGFETTAVGEPAAGAVTSGEENGAAIRVTTETAAAGKHALKFTDAPGLAREWQPHLSYQPNFRRGTVRISFDLRVEPGAIAWIEGRDAANPYRVGPSLRVRAGQLLAGEQALLPVPVGEWVHYELTCTLGQTAATYDLAVTLPGQPPRHFPGLAYGSHEFRRLQWLGFISEATDTSVFYLDNVKVEEATDPR